MLSPPAGMVCSAKTMTPTAARAAPDGGRMQNAAVNALGIAYRYGSGTEALHGVDLSVSEGSLFALLGPNGAGKTTLLQILAGLRRARRGRATVLGVDCASLSYRDRTAIAYVS